MGNVICEGIESLGDVYRAVGPRRILLVRDRAYALLPESVRRGIEEGGQSLTPFDGFSSNPLYEQVREGAALFDRERCDALLAVGGGSAIDVAKCIKLFSGTGDRDGSNPNIPLIAIPTTAGTGSESTRHAVIYRDGEKQSISSDGILPDYAILAPSVLRTLPVYQKKCTMLDALCQAIESWWSVRSNEESVGYSKAAVARILRHWEAYVFGNTERAAGAIMLAANYGGRAINLTTTTAAHAMSYKLTSLYGLPHGHAVAVCLPEVWTYMLSHTDRCVDRHGREHLASTLREISGMISPDDFKGLMSTLGMGRPRSARKREDVSLLAASVNPVRLSNNPVALDADALRGMYERIVEE